MQSCNPVLTGRAAPAIDSLRANGYFYANPSGGIADFLDEIAGTTHVVRDNIKLIKPPEKQQSYPDNLEYIYKLGMNKKREIMDTL
ncbi:MAG: hypothetical protein HY912_19100 [Desulfomonile tiedjei]|uniref:Uncharacterized protein n=1 Tax=Desulfomonile tiedjei TaxID=2358 RepID=A0A9D6V665_9BACT|nr:hypothetical protein [Desulfomonile tiedjei]